MSHDYTASELADHLLKIRAAQSSFLDFVKLHQPTWKMPGFQVKLINTLDKLEKGQLKNSAGDPVNNVLITMPPRFAKSAISTVLFPAYYMARDPSRYTMSCSYNAQLATDFGRQVRAVAEDDVMQQVFPDFAVDRNSRAADVWRTTSSGAYFAVGIGGTTSGRPASLLIVDDPIKSRDDAESITQRNKTWNYYTSALATRLQPTADGKPPKQLVILTRWHPDDLAGRLMRSEDWKEGRWTHINFQAILSEPDRTRRDKLPEDHPKYIPAAKIMDYSSSDRWLQNDGPDIERSLWPERFPLEDLQRRRRLNPREFASLYQQQPYIQGGNIIRTEWWQYYPTDLRPEKFTSIVIGVDPAFKKAEMNDYSVAVVGGIDSSGDIYIVDVLRGRFEFPELKQRLIQMNTRWRGRGLRAFYIEDKASGMSLIQELKRHSGMSVIPYKVVNDKVARVNSILPIIEGGRVYLPEEALWLDTFIEECTAFPGGTHDDQVDAMHMVIDVLSRTAVSPEDFELMADLSQSLNSIQPPNMKNSLNRKLNPKGHKPWGGWGL